MGSPTSGDDDESSFTCTARDPSGGEFFIQVTKSFGVAGPVFLSGHAGPMVQGRFLRFINKALARIQQPTTIDGWFLLVVDEQENAVHSEDPKDLGTGRARAEVIAQQIAAGTFRPRG